VRHFATLHEFMTGRANAISNRRSSPPRVTA
jgi:hypothetical protein